MRTNLRPEAVRTVASVKPEGGELAEPLVSLMRLPTMSNKTIYAEAGTVSAEDGVVHLDGPDAIDIRLTADAAEEISDRLLDAVLKARGQIFFANKKKRRD